VKYLFHLEASVDGARGGIEVFAARHAARLRAEGHEVEFSSRPDPEAFARADRIVVHKCAGAGDLAAFPPEKTEYWVHDHEPVCPRTYAYTLCRRNCSRRGGVWPCLFCAPACRDWRGALRRVFAQRRRVELMGRFDRLVVLSEFMKGRLVANGLPEGKIAVEPPDPAGFPKPSGAEVPDPVDLLYAGQLLRGKGIHVLLRALALVRRPRILDVVGTGNFGPYLRRLAERLGVAERVRWRGAVANAADWMAAAACVVVPSVWQEPYGLVAAEAVALRRPVIASDVGGLPEACGGRATLVPPGDAAALAAALDAGGDCNRNTRSCP
jgi:glycosyltransferase involved in cell wall biosynthesis